MEDVFRFADQLGPEKIVHIHEPRAGLKAIVVVDNTAAGPAIGGTRMAADVSTEECFRLARAMTFKNAAAGLAHGGAKSVIFGDPSMPPAERERLVRAFAAAIRNLEEYIPGPDMGTNETAMAWIKDEIGRAVGLPRELGGIPLDEIGATGFGLAVAAEAAQEFSKVKLDGATVVVQGFGAVGRHAARFLAGKGARLIAASDTKGAVCDPNGLDIDRLEALKAEGKSVADLKKAKRVERGATSSASPATFGFPPPDPMCSARATSRLCRPGWCCRAPTFPPRPVPSGACTSAASCRSPISLPMPAASSPRQSNTTAERKGRRSTPSLRKIAANTRAVLEMSAARRMLPREAAVELARTRVERAMSARRYQA